MEEQNHLKLSEPFITVFTTKLIAGTCNIADIPDEYKDRVNIDVTSKSGEVVSLKQYVKSDNTWTSEGTSDMESLLQVGTIVRARAHVYGILGETTSSYGPSVVIKPA